MKASCMAHAGNLVSCEMQGFSMLRKVIASSSSAEIVRLFTNNLSFVLFLTFHERDTVGKPTVQLPITFTCCLHVAMDARDRRRLIVCAATSL